MVLVAGNTMTRDHAREGGAATSFVSIDRTGRPPHPVSPLKDNPATSSVFPGIFFLGHRREFFDALVGSQPTAKVQASFCRPGAPPRVESVAHRVADPGLDDDLGNPPGSRGFLGFSTIE